MTQRRWSTCAVAAAAATILAACGGSGGGDTGLPILGPIGTPSDSGNPPPPPPPPAPAPAPEPSAPPPASSTSSGACLNEADWHVGTEKEDEVRSTGENGAVFTNVQARTTGEREAFAGLNPVPMRFPGSFGAATVVTSVYSDLVDGKYVTYGSRGVTTSENGTTTVEIVNDPPLAWPIDMQPGESVEMAYTARITSIASDGTTTKSEAAMHYQATYVGRETVQTSLGVFNACKFTSLRPDMSSTVSWISADGPYRGQKVKGQLLGPEGGVVTNEESIRMVYVPK